MATLPKLIPDRLDHLRLNMEKYGGNAEVHTMISFEMDLGVGGYK